jgi:hypothetical protein
MVDVIRKSIMASHSGPSCPWDTDRIARSEKCGLSHINICLRVVKLIHFMHQFLNKGSGFEARSQDGSVVDL